MILLKFPPLLTGPHPHLSEPISKKSFDQHKQIGKMLLKSLQIPSTKTVLSVAASASATAMLIRLIARDFVPRDLRLYVYFKLGRLLSSFSSKLTLIIDEFDGLHHNHLFKSAGLYLQPTVSPDTKRFKVKMPKMENKISVSIEKNQEIIDTFNGVQLEWKLVSKQIPLQLISDPGLRSSRHSSMLKSELRYYELSFNKKHKDMVLSSYLPHVVEKAKVVKEEKKTLKLFTLKSQRFRRRGILWQWVNLEHPATFDTLAMDTEVKRRIQEDLERFVKRKEFYRQIGKAWKRGYLLFGPPGTGKSSLIAAMANYLNFDVYDLELTDIKRNSQLRNLLVSTANRSILVVEDIDCSIQMQDRLAAANRVVVNPQPSSDPFDQKSQVTLSGFLNFIDGIWSSCGDERIIVFTTNCKERLDPALLRPGRMDVHIHLSYCTPSGFKMLTFNYFGIREHSLFSDIERLMETTKVTPAEVGEELLKNEEPDMAMRDLIEFLKRKKKRQNEIVKSLER